MVSLNLVEDSNWQQCLKISSIFIDIWSITKTFEVFTNGLFTIHHFHVNCLTFRHHVFYNDSSFFSISKMLNALWIMPHVDLLNHFWRRSYMPVGIVLKFLVVHLIVILLLDISQRTVFYRWSVFDLKFSAYLSSIHFGKYWRFIYFNCRTS